MSRLQASRGASERADWDSTYAKGAGDTKLLRLHYAVMLVFRKEMGMRAREAEWVVLPPAATLSSTLCCTVHTDLRVPACRTRPVNSADTCPHSTGGNELWPRRRNPLDLRAVQRPETPHQRELHCADRARMSETPRQNAQASRLARRQSPYTRVSAPATPAPSTPVRILVD